MHSRSARAFMAASLASTLVISLGSAGADASDQASETTFTGADGVEYPIAPKVVQGRNGDQFDGYSFDIICHDSASEVKSDLKRLGKVARIIKQSGRRAIYVIPPPKAIVNTENVIRGELPHGSCARTGLDKLRTLFDKWPDPNYLAVRPALAKDRRQLYWKTDPHWTTVGASVYTRLLATRLDPALGKRQKYKRGPDQTAVGALTTWLGDDTPETVRSLVPKTRVRVTPLPGTGALDTPYVRNHEWRSTPGKLTYPGRTLTIGDSMTYVGLDNLRPMFKRGQFLWIDNTIEEMVTAIVKADTVVFESAHGFLRVSPLISQEFRLALRRALAAE